MRNTKLKLAALLVALLVLPSCGGGGGGGNNPDSNPPPGTMITPPGSDDTGDGDEPPADHVDEPDTVAGAKTINPGQRVTGYFEEAGDMDYLRLPLSGGVNEIELDLDVPEGTQLTVQDENRNILLQRTINRGGLSEPFLVQGSVAYIGLSAPLINTQGAAIGGGGKVALSVNPHPQAGPIAWAITAYAKVKAVFMAIDKLPGVDATFGPEFRTNIAPFIKCHALNTTVRENNVECGDLKFELKHVIAVNGAILGFEFYDVRFEKGVVYTRLKCGQNAGRYRLVADVTSGIKGLDKQASKGFQLDILAGEVINCDLEECIKRNGPVLYRETLTEAYKREFDRIKKLCEANPKYGTDNNSGSGDGSDTEQTSLGNVYTATATGMCSNPLNIRNGRTSHSCTASRCSRAAAEAAAISACQEGATGCTISEIIKGSSRCDSVEEREAYTPTIQCGFLYNTIPFRGEKC